MGDGESMLALISTLISSIALAGVVLSLLIQANQLKTTQLQVARMAQFELVRMTIDDPAIFVDPQDPFATDPDSYRKKVYLNWLVKQLELGYSVRAVTEAGIRGQAQWIFQVPSRRDWWAETRYLYELDAGTKRARRFLQIVDEEHRRAAQRSSPNSPDST